MNSNTNNYNLEEAKKLNQQAANKASSTNKYNMEAGIDYDLMEAKKLNKQSRNTSSYSATSSNSSSK